MLFDRIRQAARVVERLSGATPHVVAAVNRGGNGRVTAVSSVSTPRQGGDMEKEEARTELSNEELDRVEGEALPERTQMSVVRMPGDTLPVVPPEID